MVWSSMCSVCTGRKVPMPTWSVTYSICTPFAAIASMSSGVKCSPAVGAATEPTDAAYTVWYCSGWQSLALTYGGVGIAPCFSQNSNVSAPVIAVLNVTIPSSVLDVTTKLKLSFNPVCNFLLPFTSASISPSRTLSTNTSNPSIMSRALNTFDRLNTSTSPAWSSSTMLENRSRCCIAPVSRSSTSSLEASRGSAGTWAMSSSGKS